MLDLAQHRPQEGVTGFIASMADCGVHAEIDGPVVRYAVTPVAGPHAGAPVTTAVGTAELQAWPMLPPHWIHLPEDIRFGHTNVQAQETLPGMVCHSRDIGPWLPDAHPGTRWLAHVRAALANAVAAAA